MLRLRQKFTDFVSAQASIDAGLENRIRAMELAIVKTTTIEQFKQATTEAIVLAIRATKEGGDNVLVP